MEFTFGLAVLLTACAALAAIALIKPQETAKWFQRKHYRYNVTLALYMLTPTERFIFSASSGMLPIVLESHPHPRQQHTSSCTNHRLLADSILFLTLTLLTIAACLYLPEHIAIITRRVAWYIAGGGEDNVTASTSASVSSVAGVAAKTTGALVQAAGRKSSGEVVREMLSS